MPDNTGKWFDGCQHSDIVLFDDVEIDQIPPISQFLRLTDRYAIEVPVKGGFIWWKPKIIVFTSNLPWEQWWRTLNVEHKRAVQRRLFCVTRVFKDHEIIEYQFDDWVKQIAFSTRSSGGGIPTMQWTNGIVFASSSLPTTNATVEEQLKGVLHWSSVSFAIKEKFEKQIVKENATINLVDVSVNEIFNKLSIELKTQSKYANLESGKNQ